eukprot:TRINITY_DN8586_c0_g1_i1.p1 TRINITY_DN8586_c0_g1~~TRINITY_DN8586_c0_g1_i1.p1  ORF type:complete len:817 (+),score=293.21 TRINITY_DN8586_c0_g1_i1:80-2452(+)
MDADDVADGVHSALKGTQADLDALLAAVKRVGSQDEWVECRRAFRERHPKMYGGDMLAAIRGGVGGGGEKQCRQLLAEKEIDFDGKKKGGKKKKPDDPKDDQKPAADDPKPDEPKPDEPKPDEPKPDGDADAPKPAAADDPKPAKPGKPPKPGDEDKAAKPEKKPGRPDQPEQPAADPADPGSGPNGAAPADPGAEEDPDVGSPLSADAPADVGGVDGPMPPPPESFTGAEADYRVHAGEYEPLGIELARHEDQGLIGPLFVSLVKPGGPAGRAGLPEGAIVKAIGGQPVEDMASARQALAEARLLHSEAEGFVITAVRTLVKAEDAPLSGMEEEMGSMRPRPQPKRPSIRQPDTPPQPEYPIEEPPPESLASTPCPEGWVKVPRRVVLDALERRQQLEREAAKQLQDEEYRVLRNPRSTRGPPALPFRGVRNPRDAAVLARQLLIRERLSGRGELLSEGTSAVDAFRGAERVVRQLRKDGMSVHIDALSAGRPPKQPLVVHSELPSASPLEQWAALRDELQQLDGRLKATKALQQGPSCGCADDLFGAIRALESGPDGDSQPDAFGWVPDLRRAESSRSTHPPEGHILPSWAAVGNTVEMLGDDGWATGQVMEFSPTSGTCRVAPADVQLSTVPVPLTSLRPVGAGDAASRRVESAVSGLKEGLGVGDGQGPTGDVDVDKLVQSLRQIRTQKEWAAAQDAFDVGELLPLLKARLDQGGFDDCRAALRQNGVRMDAGSAPLLPSRKPSQLSAAPSRRPSGGLSRTSSGVPPPKPRRKSGQPKPPPPPGPL